MSGTVISSTDGESKDIVLEMDSVIAMNRSSVTSKTNYLLSLDNRRQRVLTKLQSLLKHQASNDQEPIITKDKFIQLFSNNASLS